MDLVEIQARLLGQLGCSLVTSLVKHAGDWEPAYNAGSPTFHRKITMQPIPPHTTRQQI
jgi:hypothetical protein